MKLNKTPLSKWFFIVLIGTMIISCDKDDEPEPDPITIAFNSSNGTIAENSSTPFTVTISSSVAAPAAGSVDVAITGGTYGTDYTTSVGGANFTASFAAGATFATFSLQPIDNSEVGGDKTLTITLSGATGLVQLGSASTFTLTITEDDMEQSTNVTIASVRAMYSGEDVSIGEEMKITGVVISDNDATTGRNMMIQNGTDGILVRFEDTHTIPRGQSVEIDLNGGSITTFNDLLQVGGIELTAIADQGAGTLPTPQVITIDQLNTGDYESELVSIEGGTFSGANGTNTVNGNNDFTVDAATTVVRVSGPDWSSNILPRGTGTITGVAGRFRDDFQVLPQVPESFFMDMDPGGGGGTTAASIGEILAMYSGSDVAINTSTTITGVVISSNDATNGQNVVLQSGGDGIVVRFSEDHSFARGNELTVDLNGGTISDFSNLVQVSGLPLTSATDNGTSTLPDVQVITVTEFLTGNYQSELVAIENATFPDADGARTINGNNDLAVGADMTVMRISGPDWSSNALPLGSGTITGIGGVFGSTVQILPQLETDIFESAPAGSFSVVASLNNFGSVMTGVASASQSLTVATTGAIANVIVGATANFEVSLDDMMFSSSVEIDFNTTNAGPVTVYARFRPTTGVAGAIAGNITFNSTGILGQGIIIGGTEDANLMTLAGTSFEEASTGAQYVDTGDATMDHDLVNNMGQADVDFTATATEIGFDATYVASRSSDDPPGVGLTDGDNVGVTDVLSVVGSFTDGTQGYTMSDCDGQMVLTFDAVDVSSVTTKAVNLDLFIQSTGWESNDAIRIYAIADGSTEVDIFNTTGMDIDDLDMEGMWINLSKAIDATSTLQLVISLDSNSGSENIYFDNVKVVGAN